MAKKSKTSSQIINDKENAIVRSLQQFVYELGKKDVYEEPQFVKGVREILVDYDKLSAEEFEQKYPYYLLGQEALLSIIKSDGKNS